ncbi:MAG: crossover junction endodeoxyribonuclease RuvC [Pirellulales bacterium]
MAEEPGLIILGIDPALGTTGYGVIRCHGSKVQLIDAGFVRVTRTGPLENRLAEVHEGICEIIEQHRPSAMAIEQLYTHYERPTTAILMGHARGVILLAAAKASVPVASYEATKVKKMMTGNGRAPKSQMQSAVQHQLRLAKPIDPPDVADALAIALCHHQATRMPIGLSNLPPALQALQSKLS